MAALPNARHERFAQGLASGLSADEAYAKAGYAPNRGNAIRLKTNERVAARVADIVNAGAIRAAISVERVLTELGRIGFADMRKLLRWTGNSPTMDMAAAEESGEVTIGAANIVQLFASDELDDDIAACVSEVSQTKDGALKVKLHDKQAALVAIGRHLGMFKDKVEHTGKDGGPIEMEQVISDADAFTRRLLPPVARIGTAIGTGETEH